MNPPRESKGRRARVVELALVALGTLLAIYALIHAVWPRAERALDGDLLRAAQYVKKQAGSADFVLIRPTWELTAARAFLPLETGVYRSPTPHLWRGKDRIWVVTMHGTPVPAPLARALKASGTRSFGGVTVHRFEVGVR